MSNVAGLVALLFLVPFGVLMAVLTWATDRRARRRVRQAAPTQQQQPQRYHLECNNARLWADDGAPVPGPGPPRDPYAAFADIALRDLQRPRP